MKTRSGLSDPPIEAAQSVSPGSSAQNIVVGGSVGLLRSYAPPAGSSYTVTGLLFFPRTSNTQWLPSADPKPPTGSTAPATKSAFAQESQPFTSLSKTEAVMSEF